MSGRPDTEHVCDEIVMAEHYPFGLAACSRTKADCSRNFFIVRFGQIQDGGSLESEEVARPLVHNFAR